MILCNAYRNPQKLTTVVLPSKEARENAVKKELEAKSLGDIRPI
jgi:hypothetical protein